MKLEKAYQSVIVLSLGFLILGMFSKHDYLIYVPLVVLLLSAVHKKLAIWIATAWQFIGEKMGMVSSFILLSVIFLVFLFPIALLQKVFSKKITNKSSNWQIRNHSFEAASFEKPW